MKRLTSVFLPLLIIAIGHAQGPPPPLQDPFLDNFVGDWKVERKMGNGALSRARCAGNGL